MDEGFDELEVRYVGGVWVMFEFITEDVCHSFMQNEAMDHWLTEKKPWNRNFVSSDRIVWVDIEGLPIRAWSKAAFRKIIAKWGNVMHLDDMLGEDLYKNRVCMLTTYQHIISDTIKVSVDGEFFTVRVKEAPGWTPSFAKGDPPEENNGIQDEPLFDNVSNEGGNDVNGEEKDISEDPFGIYETIEKLKQEELLNGTH